MLNFGHKIVYLEAIGSKVNVELADYTAGFLDVELERLWRHQRKLNPGLGGISMKRAFFLGLAEGYREKVRHMRGRGTVGRQLVASSRALERKVALVYPKLRSVTTSVARPDARSVGLGREAGRNLSVRKGLKGGSGGEVGRIGYSVGE